jgi:5-hydroxyisourate hydrolase-like protein (transthyretin family)
MIATASFLLFSFLASTSQNGTGSVTGTIRDATGKPQAGVRVAALAVPSPGETRPADVLVSIRETSESGGYALEVPTGSYYIVAGRVDRPTYYPNATSPDRATVLSVTSGSRMAGIDFEVFVLTGVVRDPRRKPQVGVRVTAIDAKATPHCQDYQEIETETDAEGVYRLVVNSGEYFLVAGRWDRTAFYPKAENRETSTIIATNSGRSTSGLDIEVPLESSRRDRELYAVALENQRGGCFAAARLQFLTLVRTSPDSVLASDAMCEYGESFYREGSPAAIESARQQFLIYIKNFPDAPRIPQARQRLLDIEQELR